MLSSVETAQITLAWSTTVAAQSIPLLPIPALRHEDCFAETNLDPSFGPHFINVMDIQQDNMGTFNTGNTNCSTPLSKNLHHSPKTSGTDTIIGPKVEGSFNGLDGTVITCVTLEPCMYEKGKDAPSRRVEGPAEGF